MKLKAQHYADYGYAYEAHNNGTAENFYIYGIIVKSVFYTSESMQ